MLDKNICGDVYVAPNPWFYDEEYRKKAWESYEKRKANGFPCDHYVSASNINYCTDENCETFLRDLNCDRCPK